MSVPYTSVFIDYFIKNTINYLEKKEANVKKNTIKVELSQLQRLDAKSKFNNQIYSALAGYTMKRYNSGY
ncbi:MAG: hypothetical protein ACJAXM_000583 [Arenicella sp.]